MTEPLEFIKPKNKNANLLIVLILSTALRVSLRFLAVGELGAFSYKGPGFLLI